MIKKINFYNQFSYNPRQFLINIFKIYPHHLKSLYKHKKYDGKKVVLDFPPHFVSIGITGYCMNACEFCSSHCPDSGKNNFTNHQYNIPFFMNFRDFRRIVDMCYLAKVPHVHIVGVGEPFLNKDIFRMMDYVASKYCKVSIQTNFDKKLVESQNIIEKILKRKKIIKSITVDIFPREFHNEIKKGSNYDFLINSIERISNNSNIHFDIHSILTKKSYLNISLALSMDISFFDIKSLYIFLASSSILLYAIDKHLPNSSEDCCLTLRGLDKLTVIFSLTRAGNADNR